MDGLNAMLAKFPAEQQAEGWWAIAEAAGQSTTPDGRCHTENEVLLAVGRREQASFQEEKHGHDT
jgi:hypothetical protein